AAGRAVAHIVLREYPAVLARGALVVAGAGNNGGDGWVAARALHAGSVPVWVAALDPKTDDAIDNRALARVDGVREIGRDEPWPAAAIALDALLGTGATGPARGDVLALAQRLVAYGAPIVAVDGPTGLALSSGEAHGPVRAALSIAFGGARRGHLVARGWCGSLTVGSALGRELEPEAAEALEWADARVVGPGLGREPARTPFLQALLGRRPVPTVLDADALALFHGPAERPLVLTPHLGEFRAQF